MYVNVIVFCADVLASLPWLNGNVDKRRETLRALKTRRDSVAEKRRQSARPSGSDYIYSVPGTSVRYTWSYTQTVVYIIKILNEK